MCFFQDTNALVFRALLASLGVSARHDYDVNSLAVPRKAKEAIGAIALLQHKDGSAMTINVEYNQVWGLVWGSVGLVCDFGRRDTRFCVKGATTARMEGRAQPAKPIYCNVNLVGCHYFTNPFKAVVHT